MDYAAASHFWSHVKFLYIALYPVTRTDDCGRRRTLAPNDQSGWNKNRIILQRTSHKLPNDHVTATESNFRIQEQTGNFGLQVTWYSSEQYFTHMPGASCIYFAFSKIAFLMIAVMITIIHLIYFSHIPLVLEEDQCSCCCRIKCNIFNTSRLLLRCWKNNIGKLPKINISSANRYFMLCSKQQICITLINV